jgi:hypothetical protein
MRLERPDSYLRSVDIADQEGPTDHALSPNPTTAVTDERRRTEIDKTARVADA